MTTKELMKKIEKKNVFHLAWAIMWRTYVLTLGGYAIIGVLSILLTM